MKLKVPSIAVLLIAVVVQVALANKASIYGIKPDIVIVALYALSITAGTGQGLLYGCIGGLLLDCLSGGMLGLFLSGYAIAGYIAGRIGKRLFNIGETANFGGILLLSVTQGVYTAAILSTLMDGYSFFGGLFRFALPQALYSALAGTAILWLFKKPVARRVPWLGKLRPRRRARLFR